MIRAETNHLADQIRAHHHSYLVVVGVPVTGRPIPSQRSTPVLGLFSRLDCSSVLGFAITSPLESEFEFISIRARCYLRTRAPTVCIKSPVTVGV